jgi:hypothetical protein
MVDIPVYEPSYTVDEFCKAERISRSMLYEFWKEGCGPRFYLNGNTRRIPHQARLKWQKERMAAARKQEREAVVREGGHEATG